MFGNMSIVRKLQDENLPIHGMAPKLTKFPPLPEIQPLVQVCLGNFAPMRHGDRGSSAVTGTKVDCKCSTSEVGLVFPFPGAVVSEPLRQMSNRMQAKKRWDKRNQRGEKERGLL